MNCRGLQVGKLPLGGGQLVCQLQFALRLLHGRRDSFYLSLPLLKQRKRPLQQACCSLEPLHQLIVIFHMFPFVVHSGISNLPSEPRSFNP